MFLKLFCIKIKNKKSPTHSQSLKKPSGGQPADREKDTEKLFTNRKYDERSNDHGIT
ncbi:hypothetical protein OAT84_02695 [Gammaproteobacteria bacterium]|nr:hypothetical protein [Gammaproteobacteria bacterium]